MTHIQLLYFYETAKCLNISRCSEILYVSQPALSKQIKLLEQDLGTSLFIRQRNGLKLTPAGEQLFTIVQEWFVAEARMYDAIRNISSQKPHSLTVCCKNRTESTFMSYCFQILQERYPNVILNLIYGRQYDPAKKDIDILFDIVNPKDINPLKQYHIFQKEELAVFCNKNHPIAQCSHISLASLKTEKFIYFTENVSHSILDMFNEHCKDAGFSPQIADRCDTVNNILFSVDMGRGISLLKRSDYMQFTYPNTVVVSLSNPIFIETALVYKRDNLNPLIPEVIKLLEKYKPEEKEPPIP